MIEEKIIIMITKIPYEYLDDSFKGENLLKNPIEKIFNAILFNDYKIDKKLTYSTRFYLLYHNLFGLHKNQIKNYYILLNEIIILSKAKE